MLRRELCVWRLRKICTTVEYARWRHRMKFHENFPPEMKSWLRPWVVVVNNSNHKKRLCIDYSQTINKFALLDAYPFLRMQTVANSVAQYNWFSSLNLKSACRQAPILPEERLFTAFEANGQLYQFTRIPFGLKNAVPCFQRVENEIISWKYNCKRTHAYLDDITVCGRTRVEHDENLKCFLDAAKRCNNTFNEKKCTYATDSIKLLGYSISNGMLQPDPDPVKPLLELPVPNTGKELQRLCGNICVLRSVGSLFFRKN